MIRRTLKDLLSGRRRADGAKRSRVVADRAVAAAPARETDFMGVCSAYLEVGELDIFRDEHVAATTDSAHDELGGKFCRNAVIVIPNIS